MLYDCFLHTASHSSVDNFDSHSHMHREDALNMHGMFTEKYSYIYIFYTMVAALLGKDHWSLRCHRLVNETVLDYYCGHVPVYYTVSIMFDVSCVDHLFCVHACTLYM